MATREESILQETLVALYLRLNGYFVTQFIVHSAIHGLNTTELDGLAVRFPFSDEPERQVVCDPLLDPYDKNVDFLLCEVKSRGQQLRFNDALITTDGALESVIRWAGLYHDEDVAKVAADLRKVLVDHSSRGPATAFGPDLSRVRGIIFSPERTNRRNNQPWFITGPQIFQYIKKCLAPPVPRNTCATTYDFQTWGRFEQIIRYFKGLETEEAGCIKDLYERVLHDSRETEREST